MVGHRSPVTDFPQNEAGLVDKYIGTAYDVVLGVFNALPLLNDIGPQLALVTEAAETIQVAVADANQSATAAAASLAAIGNAVGDAEAHKNAAELAAQQAASAVSNAQVQLQGYVTTTNTNASSAAGSAAAANLSNLQAQQARDEAVEIAGFDVTLYVTKVQAKRIAKNAALIYGDNS